MNTKRIAFWSVFVLVLALIIWGFAVAMKKSGNLPSQNLGTPAPIGSTDHVRGPVNAPVTLIEYSDFQCPACENYYPVVTKLFNESSTTLRFVYRHFPLDDALADGTIQHPNADAAAMAAEAAGAQGKFWEMFDLIFPNHADWTELKDPKPVFEGYAAKLGLNMSQFVADESSSTLKGIVAADKKEGVSLGINSTPTFFVNGKVIANPQSYEQFKALIDAAAVGGAN